MTTERVLFCPSCAARYDVAGAIAEEPNLVLLCGLCGHAAKMSPGFTAQPNLAAAETLTEAERTLAEAQRPRVIVGHEVPAASRSIATVLRSAGYAPVCVRSGEQVLSACDPAMPARPAAVVLDVAIQGILAFEVIEQLRAQPATKELAIILLASVFERTRYKRRPTNLYGASAYLELHHVPDRLVPLIEEVRAHVPPRPERLQAPVERARAASLRGRGSADDVEAATALAHRLLSDVALYHGDELADGVRKGDPFGGLSAAVASARDLFNEASSASQVFDDELKRFGLQLLEREGRARRVDG